MIEIYLCEGGDVFVTEDGKPIWSPYGCDAAFDRGLREQRSLVKWKFESFAQAEELLEKLFDIWRRQIFTAQRDVADDAKRKIGELKGHIKRLASDPATRPELAAVLSEVARLSRIAAQGSSLDA